MWCIHSIINYRTFIDLATDSIQESRKKTRERNKNDTECFVKATPSMGPRSSNNSLRTRRRPYRDFTAAIRSIVLFSRNRTDDSVGKTASSQSHQDPSDTVNSSRKILRVFFVSLFKKTTIFIISCSFGYLKLICCYDRKNQGLEVTSKLNQFCGIILKLWLICNP